LFFDMDMTKYWYLLSDYLCAIVLHPCTSRTYWKLLWEWNVQDL